MKKTVVFDFDGVIHSYTSGWKGVTCISDPPVPGIDRSLKALQDAGYEVVVVSTRCSTVEGQAAIESWLDEYGIAHLVNRVCKEKPPAVVYVDDRAICFDGDPDSLLEKIENFKPWYQKLEKQLAEINRPIELIGKGAEKIALMEDGYFLRKIIEESGITIDRLCKLAQADRDGRCVVLPCADVAPVVRCKNCINFFEDRKSGNVCEERQGLTEPEPNDFCSYGKRKNDE